MTSATSEHTQFDEAGRDSFVKQMRNVLSFSQLWRLLQASALISVAHCLSFGAPVWIQGELQLLHSVKWQLLQIFQYEL